MSLVHVVVDALFCGMVVIVVVVFCFSTCRKKVNILYSKYWYSIQVCLSFCLFSLWPYLRFVLFYTRVFRFSFSFSFLLFLFYFLFLFVLG